MGLAKLKPQMVVIPFVAVIILLSILTFTEKGTYYTISARKDELMHGRRKVKEKLVFNTTREIKMILVNVLEQRNNLSRALNMLQQKVGQIECEKQKVSTTGGWCSQSSVENSGQHLTDKILASVLAEFFKDKYVASFGDGPGRYKQLLLDTGLLKGYDAYDGAPFSEKTSEGRVQFLDLTIPQFGLPMYDWIVSLEVAEHIPAKYESIFVDNVVRHAREGIVLSWAKLGQGGYSHVNNRPIEYVKKLLEDQGFFHDAANSTKLQNAASLPWLKWNTNVYWRQDLAKLDLMKDLLS